MRILAITNLYPNPYQPNRGPFNRQEFREIPAKHQISVIAPISWTDELSCRRKQGVKLPADRRVVCDGIEVEHPRYYFTPKVLRGSYGWFFRRSIRGIFERAVAEFRPDIVLGSWAYPDGWAAIELGRQAGLPVVVKLLGSDILMLDGCPSRKKRTQEVLRRADGLIAVSQHLANKAIELGADPNRIKVVYNGVNRTIFSPGPMLPARIRLGIDPQKPVILFVGNLNPVKGLDVLITSLAQLLRGGTQFVCYIVGQGALKTTLETQIEQLGLAEHVKLVGPRPLEQLPDWYRAADLLVLPSRSEGMPNVLLEAAACGTRYVASSVGGIPEIAGSANLLVPPENAELLAKAISEGLSKPRHVETDEAGPGTWADTAEAGCEMMQLLISVSRNRTDQQITTGQLVARTR